MENKPEFNPARLRPRVEVKDDVLFGKFLTEKRLLLNKQNGGEKLLKQIVSEIGVNVSTLAHWETGEVLPSEDKLPLIAKVYGIGLEELQEVFEISYAARQKQKEVAKSLRHHKPTFKPNPDTDVYGFGGSSGGNTKKSRMMNKN